MSHPSKTSGATRANLPANQEENPVRHTRLLIAASVGLALSAGAFAFAEEELMPHPPVVHDLDWMAGTWRSEEGPMHFEEHWTTPWGEGMYAVSRGLSDGRTSLVELSEIVEFENDLVLRLRHFHVGLKPWDSEKDGPLVWKLKELGDKRVVFEDAEQGFPKRVIYERKGDVLHAILEGERDAEPVRMAFELPLVK